jgi:hypothetical protein
VRRDGARRSGFADQEVDNPPARGIGEGAEGPVELVRAMLIFNDGVNN